MTCQGCKQDKVYMTEEQIMKDKRIVAWKAWFVSLDVKNPKLLRFDSSEYTLDDLPEDGFLMAKTRFVDGTGENIGGNGWLIAMDTPVGLILQVTGDNTPPDSKRYYGAKFIKDKLCPSVLLHVANEEMQQWR